MSCALKSKRRDAQSPCGPLGDSFLSDDHDGTYTEELSHTTPSATSPMLLNRKYSFPFMSLREEYRKDMISEKLPRFYAPHERRKMQRYESVDTYEPETTVYKDHLEGRRQEPRWFIWVFVFCIGIASSIIAITVVCVLHVLQGVRYELLGFGLRSFSFNDVGRYLPNNNSSTPINVTDDKLDVAAMFQGAGVGLYGIAPRSYIKGYLMWITCSLVLSSLSSMICAIVPECTGSGLPEVMAYLNGVRYPMLDSVPALVAKVLAIICSVASGVCTGYYSVLILTGAMLAEQTLRRRHYIQCYSMNIIECFRNPRDRRIIVVIGAAAGVASAFSVTIGGLMVVMELISTTLPVRFALYVFAASLVSSLTLQVYFSYFSYFDLRNRIAFPLGELIPEIVQTLNSRVPFAEVVQMNILYFIPAIVIGLICGCLSGLFIRISWFALVLRRRLERQLRTKVVRYILPVFFTLIYVTLNYWVAASFGSSGWEPDEPSPSIGTENVSGGISQLVVSEASRDGTGVIGGELGTSGLRGPCIGVPSTILSTRNVSVVAFYGSNGFFCAAPFVPPGHFNISDYNSYTGLEGRLGQGARPQTLRVLHSYASLAFANADSALQTLLAWRTEDMLSAPVLIVFLLIYFVSSALFLGVSLCGDTVLPGLVVGAAIGRLVGLGVELLGTYIGLSTHSWVDSGCFALIGAGSFVGGTTGLTFSICTILMECTGDFRHLLPLMMGITIAKKTAELLTHNINAIFLEARSVPMLDFENQVHKYPMFDARHVMVSPVVTLETVCSVGCILNVLQNTSHNGFPIRSVRDQTYKGIILRQQLEIVLWHTYFTLRPATCTYEMAKKVESRLFHEGRLGTVPPLESRLQERMDLSAYIDQSGFCVLDTTTLPRTYDMFRTLGLRHLVVVSKDNHILGIITRKDLIADRILKSVTIANENRRMLLEAQNRGGGSGSGGGGGNGDLAGPPSATPRGISSSNSTRGAARESEFFHNGEWIVMALDEDRMGSDKDNVEGQLGGMHPTAAQVAARRKRAAGRMERSLQSKDDKLIVRQRQRSLSAPPVNSVNKTSSSSAGNGELARVHMNATAHILPQSLANPMLLLESGHPFRCQQSPNGFNGRNSAFVLGSWAIAAPDTSRALPLYSPTYLSVATPFRETAESTATASIVSVASSVEYLTQHNNGPTRWGRGTADNKMTVQEDHDSSAQVSPLPSTPVSNLPTKNGIKGAKAHNR